MKKYDCSTNALKAIYLYRLDEITKKTGCPGELYKTALMVLYTNIYKEILYYPRENPALMATSKRDEKNCKEQGEACMIEGFQCSKRDALELENIMGRYHEFDVAFGRVRD